MSFPAVNQSQGPFSVPPECFYFARATDDGTPTGAFQITGTYASPSEFWVEAQPGQVVYVDRIDIYIQGTGNLTANGYGPISALVNGLLLDFRNPADVAILPPLVAKSTGEWSSIPGTTITNESAGAGDNYLNVEFDVLAATGSPAVLRPGYKIVVVANDNFTSLTQHFVSVTGICLDE